MPTDAELEMLRVAILEILRPRGGNITTVFAALMEHGGFEWVEDGSPIYAAVVVLKREGKVDLAEPSARGVVWKLTEIPIEPSEPSDNTDVLAPAGPAPTFTD